jgi:hypothetical protein
VVHATLGIRGRDRDGVITLEAMRAHPSNWADGNREAVARGFGSEHRRPGGWHACFAHIRSLRPSVPARRPIKPAYVRAFVRFVARVLQV